MGPAQQASYGPPKAQGVQTIPNPDTGPYSIVMGTVGNGDYASSHPLAVTRQSGAEGGSSRFSEIFPRVVAYLSNILTSPQAPGLDGLPTALGTQPREAIPTARVSGVGVTGTANGNPFAFMPPPDKFLVLNLRKLAPTTRASANVGAPSLAGTRAPKGNG